MEHGADLLAYENEYDGQLIDFSSNINPLGPPKGLDEELIESFQSLTAYPDIKYRKLKTSISNYLNCEKENVLVGNGAVEIINNFIISAERIVVLLPSFSEYKKRAVVMGKQVKEIFYEDDFSIDIDKLGAALNPGDLLILGNPNNPNGLRIPKDELLSIYLLTRAKNTFLLLDEAFFEFCPDDYDSVELFKKYDYKDVGIIRAATKFFALPGIRLGYGCTSVQRVMEIEKIELPWSVNSLADAAGKFIFNDLDYISESKAYIEKERKFLLNELSNIKGIDPYRTDTNFILIKLLEWDEEYVFNYFLTRGIVIRKCSSFKELKGNYIRVAIKDRENNLRLLEIFKNLYEEEC
jgi:threonine-phosphate decarboxylase